MTTDTTTTTDPYATNWQVDELGLMDHGGQVGGDLQATDSWTFRFVPITEPDDGLHAFVQEYWFGEQYEDGSYGVSGYAEMTICTDPDDPGSTEIWSDTDRDGFDDADVRCYDTAEAVYEAAKRAAQRSLSMPYAWVWDGRSIGRSG